MTESTSNHMKAPKCASFVARMRQAFGADQITVLYVKEGEVTLGQPTKESEFGTCSQFG